MTGHLLVLIVITGLAGYRIARALTVDSLFDGTHARIEEWAYDDEGEGRTFWRGKAGDLATCPFCIGMWVCGAVWFLVAHLADVDLSVLEHLVVWFAVAGVQSALQALDAK